MNNQSDTRTTTVSQTVNTNELSGSGTSTGIQKSSTREQSVQPTDVVNIDTSRYSSKEVKVEKIVIK
ncbi:hypothetical protein KJ980_02805 [Patescibacteria group bacterium]|nr:hypothetical protein [Patescibacteria group bacterium]MBU4017396.1 hypothetical protein [Patescibacteria group bacterium]MBU4098558.1 hypothetical protein [Patescibacteria group bacterium]